MKHELALVPDTDPAEAAHALASLEDDSQVRSIMNRLDPRDAARLVASARTVEAQSRLLWSLAKVQRAAVVDHLDPVAVAALIQNREQRNRRLLGDMSLESFRQILEFCSPKQRYYWISLANSFPDVAANLLTLLLSPEEVAEALLTVPEFQRKVRRLRNYTPGGFEKSPPVEDSRLRLLLERLAEYDDERYYEVIDAALRMGSVEEELGEDIVLPQIPEIPPLEARPAGASDRAQEEPTPHLPVPMPGPADALVRAAAALLTPERRQGLQDEMEAAFRDEVRSAGGSLAMADLERSAARVRALVRLGMHGVPEQPERVASVLEQVPLRDIIHRGSVVLEQLRQIALRLQPFEAVLDAGQRDLVAALRRPQPTMHPASGEAAILLPAADRRRRPEAVPVTAVQQRLSQAMAWVAVARALGMRALTSRLAEAPNGSQAVLAALAVSLLTYGQWDARALESPALRAFRDQRLDHQRRRWVKGTMEEIRMAVEGWAAREGIEAAMRPTVVQCVLDAASQLEKFLAETRSVAWDRFAPGKPRRSRHAARHPAADSDGER